MSVAPEKSRQAKHIAIAGGADNHRPTDALLNEPDTAQDQRAHDAFAQFGFFHQHVAEFLRGNDQGLDRALGLSIHQSGAPGKLGKLAPKRARTMGDDGRRPVGPPC